jgi:serine/threonine-protein kinase PknK
MTIDLGIDGLSEAVEIGRGSFGVVYRAHQDKFERLVAVKVLTQAVLDDSSRNRFFRECRAAGKLSGHPHVVTIYDSGFTAHGQPYLSLEYLPAGSLGDRLRANGPFGFEAATRHVIKIAGALESAHRAGLVHRDVKPDNILLDEFNEPKLTDFGIAWMSDATMTTTGGIMGSPAYMAPDVISGQPFSPNSDVYALGSTLYSLVSDRPAFVLASDESILQLLARVALEEPPDLRPGLPDPIWQVLVATLSKDPARRPQTALDFARALNAARAQLSLPPVEARVTGATGERGTGTGTASMPGSPAPTAYLSAPGAATPAPSPATPSPAPVPAATTAGAPGIPASESSIPTLPLGGTAAPGAPAPRAGGSNRPLLVGLAVLVALVVVAGAGVAIASRSGDPGAAPTTTAPTTAAVTTPTSSPSPSRPDPTTTAKGSVDLGDALLQTQDIGQNWLVDDADEANFGGFKWLTPCNKTVDISDTSAERSAVFAGFDTRGKTATSFHAVASFDDAKAAAAFMNSLPGLLSCSTWTDQSKEVHTATAKTLKNPAGDQSLLFTDTVIADATTYTHDLVFYRVGRYVGFVTNLAEGDNDPALTTHLLDAAVLRLEQVAN